MRHRAHRRLNFFDDPPARHTTSSPGLNPVFHDRAACPEAAEGPRAWSTGSESSASVEIVENVKDDLLDAKMHPGIPPNEPYVSLRQLEEAVAEAVQDVRRLDYLVVKAIWHALRQDAAQRKTASTDDPEPATSVPRPWQQSTIMSVGARRAQLRKGIPLPDLLGATTLHSADSLLVASSSDPSGKTAGSHTETSALLFFFFCKGVVFVVTCTTTHHFTF